LNEVETKLNRKISKFFIDNNHIAYVLIEGKVIFITKLINDLEFPKPDLLMSNNLNNIKSSERSMELH